MKNDILLELIDHTGLTNSELMQSIMKALVTTSNPDKIIKYSKNIKDNIKILKPVEVEALISELSKYRSNKIFIKEITNLKIIIDNQNVIIDRQNEEIENLKRSYRNMLDNIDIIKKIKHV